MRDKFLPILFLLSLISTCAEVDISVPGFVQIADFFNVSERLIQATITYNFIGYFIGAFLYGPLSDAFGRRKVMLFGNAILSLGAIGCFIAPTVSFLLAARFIQGIGAATSVVLVFTMIADLYQGEKAMKLIGLMNAALAIIMAVAPLAGGLINHAIGWRGNYGSVALFSVLVWMLMCVYLPESKKERESLKLNSVVNHYKTLFLSYRFMNASLIPSLLFAAYMSYIAASAFLYQAHYGLSTIQFVIHQAIIVSSFSIVSLYANRVIAMFGPRNTVRNGILLCCLSLFTLIVLSIESITSPYLMTLFMSLFSIGFAALYPIVFSSSLSIFPALHGPASSAIMGTRALLVSLSTAFTSFLYDGNTLSLALSIAIGVSLAALFTMSWLSNDSKKEQAAA
ncbi:multidrug effflux MFS transporter [Legionella yabuuchiae]|uniref:multidrug effflux MFS transporter n=1 Tax=Legionella yabuuchiae TaxID=376727 RepID=UPI0010546742|nr:multidrug effflux MFS transporter [Legionella yabuuchiae]